MQKQSMSSAILEIILEQSGIGLTNNEIIHREEISDKYGILNDSEQPLDTLVAYICDKYRDEYKYCTKDQVFQMVHLIATRNNRNPILDRVRLYSKGRIIKGYDYISEISHDVMRIPQDDILSHLLIKKWFLQAIALLQNDNKRPYGADGMLVLVGNQGIAKSLFCECTAIESNYYRSISVNQYGDETDTLSKANGIFIGEFSELERSLKPSTMEFFKAFITSGKDSYRPKYGRTMCDYIRRSSYIGTCNTDSFLMDRTGNRRFWVISFKDKMDIHRLVKCKNGEDDIFIKAYAQAYLYLKENGLQSFRLTDSEREQVEARNKKYLYVSDLENILHSILLYSGFQEFTIEELKESNTELQQFDNTRIGRVLTKQLHMPNKTKRIGNSNVKRVYTNTLNK